MKQDPGDLSVWSGPVGLVGSGRSGPVVALSVAVECRTVTHALSREDRSPSMSPRGDDGWVMLPGCDCPCHAENEKRGGWGGTCKQECCEPWIAAKKLPPKRPYWQRHRGAR